MAENLRDLVTKAALAGAKKAVEGYLEMSGGRTVHDHGIETYISAKVAENLFEELRARDVSVMLEASFNEIWELSGARKGRAAEIITKTSRVDVCYLEKGKPIAVIEVKKRFAAHKLDKDMDRVLEIIRRFGPDFDGSLQFGVALAVQRVGVGARTTPESQMEGLLNSYTWGIQPKIECEEIPGDFGSFKRSGRSVDCIRIFAVSFLPDG